ncbi:MAG TPA: LemA family protein [Pyrinomonadaceae bacterium]|nr:LemA family protein [Pyrinomonadaceae bacterium]
MKKTVLLYIVLFAAIGLSGCSYNTLTAEQQGVKGKWANVESTMQSRADRIPNLFEVAKAAGIQEQEVFGRIADARSRLINAQQEAPQGTEGDKSPEQKQKVIQANGDLSRLLLLFENYPNLRSNEGFLKVQDEIAGIENRINAARLDYNEAVQKYNTSRNSFPAVLTAGMLGFKEEPYFQADERAKEVPKLDANTVRPQTPQTANTATTNTATTNTNK